MIKYQVLHFYFEWQFTHFKLHQGEINTILSLNLVHFKCNFKDCAHVIYLSMHSETKSNLKMSNAMFISRKGIHPGRK